VSKTVVITGISGTLGAALGQQYLQRGWRVVGVTRQQTLEGAGYTELCTNAQQTVADAQALLAYDPDVVILNAGQIETEIGAHGEPLVEAVEAINRVNYLFPALVALAAADDARTRRLDVIAIGSIADGSPSCFGPVYHASKIALHYFFSGVGPILHHAYPHLRLRLYRPGVIKGPLSWAPVNRVNDTGYRIRARRCNNAPEASSVAHRIVRWIDGDQWVGTYDEPLSFKFFKYLFVLAPNVYYKLQLLGWRKGSKFAASAATHPTPQAPQGAPRA
jgi:NAD(P)-dependent dehydrogenase (short-subunit alcohol dehydrogenase family)